MAKKSPKDLKKKKDESKKPKKGVNPFAKKGEKGKTKKPKKGVNPFAKKGNSGKKSKTEDLNENLLKFVDMMIAENYSNAHKILEIVINDKLKSRIAEAAKKDLFPKAKDNNPKYLKKQSKNSCK
jgi:hypothetical protein